MKNRLIFIPYRSDKDETKNENPEDLMLMALDWREARKKSNKPEKAPTMVVYGEDKFNKDLKNLSLYVIGHGVPHDVVEVIGGGLWICNTDEYIGKVTFLSPERLVARLIETGLKPEMDARIKLYFCEEIPDNAEKFAIEVMKELTKIDKNFASSKTSVDYYKAIMTPPIVNESKARDHKLGVRKRGDDELVPAESLLKYKKEDFVIIGRASDERIRVRLSFPFLTELKKQNQPSLEKQKKKKKKKKKKNKNKGP